MKTILTFEDLLNIDKDDECIIFKNTPYAMVNEQFFVIEDGDDSSVFSLNLNDSFINIYYNHRTKQIDFKEFYSDSELTTVYRPNSLPTSVHYDQSGNIMIEEWFYKTAWARDNRFSPTKIDYNFKKRKDVHMFTYSRVNKKEFDKDVKYNNVYVSYIIYSVSMDSVIDASFYFCGKKLNIREMSAHFPNLIDITLEDCFDLEKRIFTDDLVTIVDMMNI